MGLSPGETPEKLIITSDQNLIAGDGILTEGEAYTMGLWKIKAGKESEFIDSFVEYARSVNESLEGTMGVKLTRYVEDSSHFMTFGPWASMEDIKR